MTLIIDYFLGYLTPFNIKFCLALLFSSNLLKKDWFSLLIVWGCIYWPTLQILTWFLLRIKREGSFFVSLSPLSSLSYQFCIYFCWTWLSRFLGEEDRAFCRKKSSGRRLERWLTFIKTCFDRDEYVLSLYIDIIKISQALYHVLINNLTTHHYFF